MTTTTYHISKSQIALKIQVNCELCSENYTYYKILTGSASSSGGSGGILNSMFPRTIDYNKLGNKANKELSKAMSQVKIETLPLYECPYCGYYQSWSQKKYFKSLNTFVGWVLLILFVVMLYVIIAFSTYYDIYGNSASSGSFVFSALSISTASLIPLYFVSKKRIKRRFFSVVNQCGHLKESSPCMQFVNPNEAPKEEKYWQWKDAKLYEKFGYLIKLLFTNKPIIFVPEEISEYDDNIKQDTQLGNIDYMTSLIIDVLCCVICADGYVAPEERELLYKIISKYDASLSEESIDQRVVMFLQKIGGGNFDSIAKEVYKKVSLITNDRNKQMIKKTVKLMIKIDDKIDAKEVEVYKKMKEAMGLS